MPELYLLVDGLGSRLIDAAVGAWWLTEVHVCRANLCHKEAHGLKNAGDLAPALTAAMAPCRMTNHGTFHSRTRRLQTIHKLTSTPDAKILHESQDFISSVIGHRGPTGSSQRGDRPSTATAADPPEP